ncbi:hypothetical protein T484DRAFT_1752676 [Baffinella frigidus]|nr:hypothetical protein T484DRAFT_1752676 [Cryptophyta sp. CCMP2293]
MLVAADVLLGAVQAVAVEQRVRPEHPSAWHDAFLARRHAERLPYASSLTTKLMRSFDLPADGNQQHHADDGCECDERTSSDSSSGIVGSGKRQPHAGMGAPPRPDLSP